MSTSVYLVSCDGLMNFQIGHDVQLVEAVREAGRDGAVDERTFPRRVGGDAKTWQDEKGRQRAQPDQRRS